MSHFLFATFRRPVIRFRRRFFAHRGRACPPCDRCAARVQHMKSMSPAVHRPSHGGGDALISAENFERLAVRLGWST